MNEENDVVKYHTDCLLGQRNYRRVSSVEEINALSKNWIYVPIRRNISEAQKMTLIILLC